MTYYLDMTVLRLYSKQEHLALNEISRLLNQSNNTISRYVGGARQPDLPTLLHLCNTLRVSVGAFIHHSDVIPDRLAVYDAEQFQPVSYRYDAIENYRREHGMTRTELLQNIRKTCNVTIDPSTYIRISEGKRAGLDLPIGFLNTYGLGMDYLFEDAQLSGACLPTEYQLPQRLAEELNSLRARMNKLENANRQLTAENEHLKSLLNAQTTQLNGGPETLGGLADELYKLASRLANLDNTGVTPPPPSDKFS